MKTKFNLFTSIFQLIVGLLAIVSFIILWANGEVVTKWIITLVLAVVFVILGVVGVIDYISARKNKND